MVSNPFCHVFVVTVFSFLVGWFGLVSWLMCVMFCLFVCLCVGGGRGSERGSTGKFLIYFPVFTQEGTFFGKSAKILFRACITQQRSTGWDQIKRVE